MKKKEKIVLFCIIFIIAILTIVALIMRKIYWEKKFKESREKIAKLMEEAKKRAKQHHSKHIEAGINYDENCDVCKGRC